MLRALTAGSAAAVALLILAGAAVAAPPAHTTWPTISGDPTSIGNTLTVDNERVDWTGSPTFTYQWLRCEALLPPQHVGACTPIDAATSTTYELSAQDGGHVVSAEVTATNADGSTAARAYTNGIAGAPQATIPAGVAGDTSSVGATLTADHGHWTGSPTTFGYRWLRCSASFDTCTTIDGATGPSYTIAAADVGSHLMVVVSASGATTFTGYAASSTNTIGIPAFRESPTVEGDTTTVGSALTIENVNVYGPSTSYAYQWFRCPPDVIDVDGCTSIGGATSRTYTTGTDDLGRTLAALVTATNGAGSASAAGYSIPIGVPAGGYVLLAGSHSAAGDTLIASTGGWSGSPTSFEYMWSRCDLDYLNCTDTGVRGTSYTLTSGDIGKRLLADVSAANATGSWFAESERIAGAPSALSGQAITGAPAVGSTLGAVQGTWAGSPTSFAYRWQRCNATGGECADIDGATGSTYSAVAADLGKTLDVDITATNAFGSEHAVTGVFGPIVEAPAAPVEAAPSPAPTSAAGAAPAVQATPATSSSAAAPGKAGSVHSQAATVSWQSQSIDGQATVELAPPPAAVLQPLGSAPVVSLNVTASDGTAITAFGRPVQIVFAAGDGALMPAYSLDGRTWTAIPKLAGPTLAADAPDGWYVDGEGKIAILTRHATYFALLPASTPLVPELALSTNRSPGKLHVRIRSSLPGTAVAVLRRGSTVLATGRVVLTAAGSARLVLRAPRGGGNLTVVMRTSSRQASRVIGIH